MPNSNTENAIALGLVVMANWVLAHTATEWVMPSEVQSSLQSFIIASFGAYLQFRRQKAFDSSPVTNPAIPEVKL